MSKMSSSWFDEKIREVINTCRRESDLTVWECIGALECVKADLIVEFQKLIEEEKV